MLTCRRAQRFVFPYKMSWPHELGNNWSVRCCWPSASVYRKPVHFTNVWYSRYNNAARAQSQRTRLQIHRRTTAVVSVQRNSPSRSKQRRPCFSTLVSLSFSSCYGASVQMRTAQGILLSKTWLQHQQHNRAEFFRTSFAETSHGRTETVGTAYKREVLWGHGFIPLLHLLSRVYHTEQDHSTM